MARLRWLFSPSLPLVQATFYLAYMAVASRALFTSFDNGLEYRWAVLGLLLGFGLLSRLCWLFPDRPWWASGYLAAQTAIIVVLSLLPPNFDVYNILFFLLAAQATMSLPPPARILWLGAFSLSTLGTMVNAEGLAEGIPSAVTFISGYVFFAVFASLAAKEQFARARAEGLLQELEEANRKLQDYAQRAQALAVAEERNRLARDLHDSVTQSIFSMTLITEAAHILLDREPSQVGQHLDRLQELANAALEEMRSLISQMRPRDDAERALVPALRRHLATVSSRERLAVDLDVNGDEAAFVDPKGDVLRVVQEALNNVSKHAKTDRARVGLRMRNGAIIVTIEDAGAGFDPATVPNDGSRIGLSSMRERVEIAGGQLSIESVPHRGTKVTVQVPAGRAGGTDG